MKQLGLTALFRVLHPAAIEFTFFFLGYTWNIDQNRKMSHKIHFKDEIIGYILWPQQS